MNMDLYTYKSQTHLPRTAIIRAAAVGFALMVAMVLLAAYVGYRGSDRIQDTAQTLIREQLVRSARGAEVESLIVEETQELVDELRWVLGLCIVLAFGTAGLTVWLIQRAFARLEWQAEELAHVSWSMVDSHEKMAQRFSHEMHDELGQSLSGLRRMLGSMSESNVGQRRQECMGIVDEVLQTVRKLSQVLRPVILDDFGLDSGLKWLCERFTQRMGIEVDYQSNFNERLAEPLETHLFRITQEALTNVARHSGATQASVVLRVTGDVVRLEILDNGVGLPESAIEGKPSIGMVGMRARARQIGGKLIVENRGSGGVRICVDAPVQRPQPGYEREQQQEDPGFAS
ncbi:hypothetical protein F183_A17330 [Bryobacterales bacterium F-183]|nr:hypothetical protein F183_A17330 [Bryobacterales bacterium F-183]